MEGLQAELHGAVQFHQHGLRDAVFGGRLPRCGGQEGSRKPSGGREEVLSSDAAKRRDPRRGNISVWHDDDQLIAYRD